MRMKKIDTSQYMLQMERSARLMQEYEDYARSIGCTVGEGMCRDEIQVHTTEQAQLLAEKWNKLSE